MSRPKLRVALLAGGTSDEREVSLAGAQKVDDALDRRRYEVTCYDPGRDMAAIVANSESIDVAFILLHGRLGEDGTVQGFLDLLGIPYQGSGVLGSALAMDKDIAKTLYRENGLPVAPWCMALPCDIEDPRRLLEQLELPLVVKPIHQGSSVGMSIAHTEEELVGGIKKAFAHDCQVMVEHYIKGREITVGVIGNDQLTALPVVEIIPGKDHLFFDYEAKYRADSTREICPAELDTDLSRTAGEYAVRAHTALKLRGYSRTDMIVSSDGIYLLETNTIPGMTPASLLPQAAAAAGLSFPQLLDRLIELAMEK